MIWKNIHGKVIDEPTLIKAYQQLDESDFRSMRQAFLKTILQEMYFMPNTPGL